MTVQREQEAGAPSAFSRLAGLCHDHRRWVLVLWLLLLVGGFAAANRFGGQAPTAPGTAGSESQRAFNLLQARFPGHGGDTIDVVYRAETGVRDPGVRERVEALLAELRTLPDVSEVSSPYQPGRPAISTDGKIAFATVHLGVHSAALPADHLKRIVDAAARARAPGLAVELAGQPVSDGQESPPTSEALGLIAAAVILLLAFGSVVAMGLPIITALFGIGISVATTLLLTNIFSINEVGPAVAGMIGLGVGIDYALLIVTRYREFTAAGAGPREAVIGAMGTAGRAVVFAGACVAVCLLAMFAMRDAIIDGIAVAAAIAVSAMVLASVTLLPALLGFLGANVDRLRIPGMGRDTGSRRPFAYRWSRTVQRRPVLAAAAATVALLLLAAPILGLRLGMPDAGNDPPELTTRKAYDLLRDGFGPGFTGPLLLAAELPDPAARSGLEPMVADLRRQPGVASVTMPILNPTRDVAVLTVIPTTGPQSEQTEHLVNRLRRDVLPAVAATRGITVSVGGITAANIDMTETLGGRLPLFIGLVLALSLLLLLTLLRSVAVAIKAAVANLLSVGAAFGVVSLFVTNTAGLGELVGIPSEIPVPIFVPLLMFAILFGLSTDYEVFLMARIREEYLRTGNSDRAAADGLAATARVITAAAAVMVAVFGAFVLSDEVFLKAVGIGMASAVLIDATIVRMVLVPAVMKLLGDAGWWIPRWLDRILPQADDRPHASAMPHRQPSDPDGALVR